MFLWCGIKFHFSGKWVIRMPQFRTVCINQLVYMSLYVSPLGHCINQILWKMSWPGTFLEEIVKLGNLIKMAFYGILKVCQISQGISLDIFAWKLSKFPIHIPYIYFSKFIAIFGCADFCPRVSGSFYLVERTCVYILKGWFKRFFIFVLWWKK